MCLLHLSHFYKVQPGIPVHSASRCFKLFNGPSEVWQGTSHNSFHYIYIYTLVCMLSHWSEAFPSRQAIAFSVAKSFWNKMSLLASFSGNSRTPFYWPYNLTSLCCFTSFTFYLHLPPQSWFSFPFNYIIKT